MERRLYLNLYIDKMFHGHFLSINIPSLFYLCAEWSISTALGGVNGSTVVMLHPTQQLLRTVGVIVLSWQAALKC